MATPTKAQSGAEIVPPGSAGLWAAGPDRRAQFIYHHPAVRDPAKGRRVAGDRNLKLEAPHGTDSSQTHRWREMDANFWFLATVCLAKRR
jgi:hypothetical protein